MVIHYKYLLQLWQSIISDLNIKVRKMAEI